MIDQLVTASFFIMVIAVMDGIDGDYARRTEQVTDKGVMLDPLVDFVTFGVIFAGLCRVNIVSILPLSTYYFTYIYSFKRAVDYENKGIKIPVRISVLSYFAGTTAERLFLAGALILGTVNAHVLTVYLLGYYSLVMVRIAVHRTRTLLVNASNPTKKG